MISVKPIAAMLWENWRLTRVEAAQRLALGLVAGAVALSFFDIGATVAFGILVLVHSYIWFSIAKLNGGRFADGYKPGFPLHLLYTRPVPTVVLVGVAMAYDAVSCMALYLVSAAVLGFAFGKPLPLFSVALCLVAYHFAYTCCQWSTRNRVVQWVGLTAFSVPMFFLLYNNVTSPLRVEFSLTANVVMALVCVVAFGLTVAGVARQRRGDAVATVSAPKAASGGYPDWLVSLFRFPCPTSSATKAQLWFEFRSSGLPVLTFGVVVATLLFLLFAISTAFVPLRNFAVPLTLAAAPVLVLLLGNNAFGIRRKQGRIYASPFEMTQPHGSAQLAAIKLLVRTACVLLVLGAIGASWWASSSRLDVWGAWFPDGKTDALPGLLDMRSKLAGTWRELSGYARFAWAVILSIAVALVVCWKAASEALRARYPRLLLLVQWLPAAWGLVIVLLTVAVRKGFGPVPLVGRISIVTFWITGAAMLLATIYLLWSGFAERALTLRYACGALVISAAFGAAWQAGIPVASVVGVFWWALMILMVSLLAPWSLNRIRHA